MDAVDVVAAGHLTADACDIVARLWQFGVHVVLVADLNDASGIFLTKQFAAIAVGLAYRDGDNPRMTLYTSLVAFADAELEGVVAWRFPIGVGETWIPGLDG